MILYLLMLISLVVNYGCVSQPTQQMHEEPSDGELTYTNGQSNLKQKLYSEALYSFDSYLQKHPGTRFYIEALMGSAEALHNLGRYEEASERLRKVLNMGDPAIRAQALVKLSYCYEALNKNIELVAALKDALIYKNYLSPPVWRAEIPARLSTAYLRLGMVELAEKHFGEAEAGLSFIRKQRLLITENELLGKTLYHMGLMTKESYDKNNFFDKVKTLEKAQGYSLQAVELGNYWGTEAKKEIVSIYLRLWEVIATLPMSAIEDKALANYEKRFRQQKMGEKLLEAINDLRAKRLPAEVGGSKQISELFSDLQEIERQIQQLIAENIRQDNGLTDKARNLNRLRLNGRVVDPSGALESNIKLQKDPNL